MAQSKISTSYDETSEYKKNNWKALIGMRLNSNWSIEGQYTNFAKDLFKTDNAITFNCVFILLPLYYIIFKKTSR
jgi:hypothetical protein